VSRICPHCNHIRQAGDDVPDWQCPACLKAYAKAGIALPPEKLIQYGPNVAQRSAGRGKWLFVLLALGAAFWFGRTLSPQRSAPVEAAAGQPAVVLYATEWCGYCKATRAFFAANGIRYIEHDIEKSSTALSEHRKLGGNGVPLIVVGDELIKGYNEQTLRQLLGPWLQG